MRYKIILKTSSRHLDRIRLCLDTWLRDQDYICLIDNLVGGVGEEFSGSKRVDYDSAEEKTATFINYCISHKTYSDYDWLIFIDDDAILNNKATHYILPYLDSNYVYGINMRGAWPNDPDLQFPSGGGGYFISPKLIQSMEPMEIHGHGKEDVSVGQWLKKNNISIKNTFDINEKTYMLYLNGWYPLSRLKQTTGLNKDEDLINKIDDEHIAMLKRHITHHYIRTKELMTYINSVFSEWLPKDLVLR